MWIIDANRRTSRIRDCSAQVGESLSQILRGQVHEIVGQGTPGALRSRGRRGTRKASTGAITSRGFVLSGETMTGGSIYSQATTATGSHPEWAPARRRWLHARQAQCPLC